MNPVDAAAAACSLPLAGALVVLARNFADAPSIESGRAPARRPRTSVLVPARDEERNLERTLDAWSRVEGDDWEILVLDDRSSDRTPEILDRWRRRMPNLEVLRGTEVPDGWKGKNWACAQLAAKATGSVLLFADADVEPHPEALESTLAALESEGADAVSGFGRQEPAGWAALSAVPLVLEVPAAALLPLRTAADRPEPSLSAAVGQWFAFRREAYDAIGGHAAVKGEVAEDIALARLLKASGRRIVPARARGILVVRMYEDLGQVWNGFSKNLSLLAGGGVAGSLATIAGVLVLYVLPWLLPISGRPSAWIPLGLLVLLRLGNAAFWGTPARRVLLHPVGSLLLLAVAIRTLFNPLRPVAWKGRLA